jgi:hypothetical protein
MIEGDAAAVIALLDRLRHARTATLGAAIQLPTELRR